jgi:hypothetical protein
MFWSMTGFTNSPSPGVAATLSDGAALAGALPSALGDAEPDGAPPVSSATEQAAISAARAMIERERRGADFIADRTGS